MLFRWTKFFLPPRTQNPGRYVKILKPSRGRRGLAERAQGELEVKSWSANTRFLDRYVFALSSIESRTARQASGEDLPEPVGGRLSSPFSVVRLVGKLREYGHVSYISRRSTAISCAGQTGWRSEKNSNLQSPFEAATADVCVTYRWHKDWRYL